MIILPDNFITSATWSSEDPEWPAANVLDDHPQNVAKSTLQSDTLTLNLGPQSNILYLDNVSALSAVATLKDSSAQVVATYELEFVVVDDIEAFIYDLGREYRNVKIDFPFQEDLCSVELTFTAVAGQVPEVGVARAGFADYYPNPEYGLVAGSKDLSIEEPLNNGAAYRIDGSVLRTWSGELDVERDQDGWRFLEFKKNIKKRPFVCVVADGVGSYHDFMHFVRFDQDPSAAMSGYNRARLRFTLIEEV